MSEMPNHCCETKVHASDCPNYLLDEQAKALAALEAVLQPDYTPSDKPEMSARGWLAIVQLRHEQLRESFATRFAPRLQLSRATCLEMREGAR